MSSYLETTACGSGADGDGNGGKEFEGGKVMLDLDWALVRKQVSRYPDGSVRVSSAMQPHLVLAQV